MYFIRDGGLSQVDYGKNSDIVGYYIMDWSRNFKIEQPGHVAGIETIDPEIFEELALFYPNTLNKVAVWEKGRKRRNMKTPMLRVLSQVTERLSDYVGETTGRTPKIIEHSVRTAPLLPRRAQLNVAGSWHTDGKLDETRPIVFMSANNKPTEFLTPGAGADGVNEVEWVRNARSTHNFFDNNLIGEGIGDGLLGVHQSNRFEGVVTQGNVHRSPRNYSNDIIKRTFFLLWIKSEQWAR